MSMKVTHHDSALGRWADHLWRPDEGDALAGLVEHVRFCEGSVAARRERVLPSGAVDVVLHLSEPVRLVREGRATVLSRVALAGPRAEPIELEAASPAAAGVSIRLRPAGARKLFRAPMADFAGRVEDLTDVLGPSADELIARCAEAASPAERVGTAAAWLRCHLAPGAGPPPEIAWAAGEIWRRGGAVPIAQLRERTGWSRPRFVAAFREHVGMAPKAYTRVVRFQRALALLGQPARPSHGSLLSHVALAAGFADQAHMNADFRALAGVTPGEFLSSARDPRTVSIAVDRASTGSPPSTSSDG